MHSKLISRTPGRRRSCLPQLGEAVSPDKLTYLYPVLEVEVHTTILLSEDMSWEMVPGILRIR
jgi:hypothetical protein